MTSTHEKRMVNSKDVEHFKTRPRSEKAPHDQEGADFENEEVEQSETEKAQKSLVCIGQFKKIEKIKFTRVNSEPTDTRELFRGSQFYDILGMKQGSNCSASLIEHFCNIFDEKSKTFIIKEGVTISFCVREVANVLGIKYTGLSKQEVTLRKREDQLHANSFPAFVADLKDEYGKDKVKTKETKNKGDTEKLLSEKTKRKLGADALVEILNNIDLQSAERREQYEKLVRFYVLDQILLPSGEQAFCRSTDFKYVNDLLICEEINWAKEILDSIHVAASRVKKKDTRTFAACSSVFQAMIFARIPKLVREKKKLQQTCQLANKYPNMRGSVDMWNMRLSKLNSEDIASCQFCHPNDPDIQNFDGACGASVLRYLIEYTKKALDGSAAGLYLARMNEDQLLNELKLSLLGNDAASEWDLVEALTCDRSEHLNTAGVSSSHDNLIMLDQEAHHTAPDDKAVQISLVQPDVQEANRDPDNQVPRVQQRKSESHKTGV